jgi:uncharacterized protein (DUF305 family)
LHATETDTKEKNMRTKTIVIALLSAAGLALSGCGSNGPTAGRSTAKETAAAFVNADVTFAQGMIPHHEQAVEMAKLADTRASSPEVKQLAQSIDAAQGPEIQTMTGWLKDWGKDLPSGGDSASMPGMDMSGGQMPGMMSAEDMSKLEGASGHDFDTMFLTMMIEHHKGAIEMATTEQSEGKNPDAVALAKKIITNQQAEIDTMKGLLGS